jgi:fumarate hydratase class I
LPEIDQEKLGGQVVKVDLRRPMKDILAQLSKYPVKTRLSLTGTMIVARDLAHAKLRERLEAGKGMPDYFKNHPIYYAGPAKTRGATPQAHSARRRLGVWIAISISSRPPAAR